MLLKDQYKFLMKNIELVISLATIFIMTLLTSVFFFNCSWHATKKIYDGVGEHLDYLMALSSVLSFLSLYIAFVATKDILKETK